MCMNQGVQGKCSATRTRTTPFSKEKGAALGGTRTHGTLLVRDTHTQRERHTHTERDRTIYIPSGVLGSGIEAIGPVSKGLSGWVELTE